MIYILPMTDPWCWYINANIKGYIDGIHVTINIAYMDPMGYKDCDFTQMTRGFFIVAAGLRRA